MCDLLAGASRCSPGSVLVCCLHRSFGIGGAVPSKHSPSRIQRPICRLFPSPGGWAVSGWRCPSGRATRRRLAAEAPRDGSSGSTIAWRSGLLSTSPDSARDRLEPDDWRAYERSFPDLKVTDVRREGSMAASALWGGDSGRSQRTELAQSHTGGLIQSEDRVLRNERRRSAWPAPDTSVRRRVQRQLPPAGLASLTPSSGGADPAAWMASPA